MLLTSVFPLDTDHAAELCEDILAQYRSGALDTALFMMTLVPEGLPAIDKAAALCEKFDVFRERLAGTGVRVAILAQATIGHGWVPDEPISFTRYKNLRDGREEFLCCPYDEGFQDYIRGAFRTLALHKPDMIMVDDDFRLIFRPGHGCACDRHMAELNRRAGTQLTREQLLAHTEGLSPEDVRITKLYIETQGEALIGAAKAMREGIDSVNSALPGTFCLCGNAAEFAGTVAPILAGKGNPVIVRVNNGNYMTAGARGLSRSMLRAASQIAVMSGTAQQFLAETDTCPHNRYSTAALSMHAHFTGTILEGASGAKHWVTRLPGYEPESGAAYRAILAKYAGFYRVLSELTPTLKWRGCRVPLSRVPAYGYASSRGTSDGWCGSVLEWYGLPMYFSAQPGGAVFMDGSTDAQFTDAEITDMLRGTLVLSAEACASLNARGFAAYTGAEVRPWSGVHASGELLPGGKTCEAQHMLCELVPAAGARTDSEVYHIAGGKKLEKLFPGVTDFRNPLGGRTVVFCGTPKTPYPSFEAFSFLNQSRKRQLIGLLADELPLWYPGDAELYLRAADTEDGSLLCAVFNLGLDPLEALPLEGPRKFTSAEKLSPSGKWQPCAVAGNGVQTPVNTLEPVILRLK